jgi:prepilin-type processing-associated H-X9-DG protein
MIRSNDARRQGSALVAMIVLVSLAAFGVGLLLPAMGKSRETANRVKCANNLRQIGLATVLYANDNRGVHPRTKFVPADKLIPDVTNGGADSADPFKPDTTVPANCVPSAIFLLLRTEDITPAVFNCPSAKTAPDPVNDASRRSNFTDLKFLSYSYANPYPDNGALARGYKLSSALDAGFAVAADLNPGATAGSNVLGVTLSSTARELAAANSRNHGQAGQNVLFADGHVEFDATVFVGENQDNIYCRGMGGPNASKDDIVNSPKDKDDSVLLPTDSE